MRAAGGGGAAEAGVAAYHQADGVQVSQVFWSDPAAPEVQPTLSADDLARKTDAFAAYASQTDVMSHFFPDREAYRLAPVYDFTHPPRQAPACTTASAGR